MLVRRAARRGTAPERPPPARFLCKAAVLAVAAVAVAGCATGTSAVGVGPRAVVLGPDLELRRVTDEVWVHVSADSSARWGSVPANGVLVGGGDETVLIDTGWNPSQTERLLDFAVHAMNGPVRQFIATHAHPDRVGGALALSGHNVVIHAQAQTARALDDLNLGLEIVPYDEEATITVGHRKIELFYPGPGHTRDNAVVYLPEEQVLFAGCVVKSRRANDLGNREDAVLAAWPKAVFRLLDRYGTPAPDAPPSRGPVRRVALVIPGHGPPGGMELLDHTLGLLEQAIAPAGGKGQLPTELN